MNFLLVACSTNVGPFIRGMSMAARCMEVEKLSLRTPKMASQGGCRTCHGCMLPFCIKCCTMPFISELMLKDVRLEMGTDIA